MAKPTESLAEKDARYRKESDEVTGRFMELLRGAAKAMTTDIPGLVIDVADKLAGDTARFGEKDRSSQFFEALTGSKSTGSAVETLGGLFSPESAVKAMVVGAVRLAKTGKIPAISEAESLMADGMQRADVFNSTGTYKDNDGKLKAVISDKNATARPGAVQGEDILSNQLNHPELFALYPELRNMSVYGLRNPTAFYIPSEKAIGIGPTTVPKREALLHEVQHAIQAIEGSAKGGNAQAFLSFDPYQTLEVVNRAKASSDASVKAAAERLHASSKAKQSEAYEKYMKLPGEQEARFTADSGVSSLNTEALNTQVLRMLSKGDTPQDYYGKSASQVAGSSK